MLLLLIGLAFPLWFWSVQFAKRNSKKAGERPDYSFVVLGLMIGAFIGVLGSMVAADSIREDTTQTTTNTYELVQMEDTGEYVVAVEDGVKYLARTSNGEVVLEYKGDGTNTIVDTSGTPQVEVKTVTVTNSTHPGFKWLTLIETGDRVVIENEVRTFSVPIERNK